MKLQIDKYDINNHYLSITWLLLLILPNNNLLYYFVPLSFILLYKFNKRNKTKYSFLLRAMIISLVFTLLINYGRDYALTKDIFRLITLIIILASFAGLKGNVILKQYIVFAALFLIISQFAFALKITPVMDLIKSYYPLEDEVNVYLRLENYSISNFGIQRLGGIYYNPNQYARYIEFVLIALLCEVKQFRKQEITILLFLIIVSIAATGSRTSFLVLVAIALVYLYSNKLMTKKNVLLLSVVGIGVILYLLVNTNFLDLRIFKVNEGFDTSLNIKIKVLTDYLSANKNFLTLFFGNLSPMVLIIKYNIGILGTDFDIGNIIVYYGFAFLFLLFLFIISIYRKMDSKYKIVFCILLWMFSSAIITNYRTAPLFFLMLGLYYSRSVKQKKYNE